MKKISEIADKLYKNQLLTACKVVIEGGAKVSSIILDSKTFEIIIHAIPRTLISKSYKIDDKYSLIVLAKSQETIDMIEEINDLTITKTLRDRIYKDLLGTL